LEEQRQWPCSGMREYEEVAGLLSRSRKEEKKKKQVRDFVFYFLGADFVCFFSVLLCRYFVSVFANLFLSPFALFLPAFACCNK
jgi:hypothetical protein